MLDRSSLSKGFENGAKLWGIDLVLLLSVLMAMSVLNFFLGSFSGGFMFALGLPVCVGGVIHFKSRNKPDGYLRDVFLFYRKRGVMTAAKSRKGTDE